jgi:hypothetical protein
MAEPTTPKDEAAADGDGEGSPERHPAISGAAPSPHRAPRVLDMRRPRAPAPEAKPNLTWPQRPERPERAVRPKRRPDGRQGVAFAPRGPELTPSGPPPAESEEPARTTSDTAPPPSQARPTAPKPTTTRAAEAPPKGSAPSAESAPLPFVPLIRAEGGALKNKKKKAALTAKEALAAKVKASAARHPPRPSPASRAAVTESDEEPALPETDHAADLGAEQAAPTRAVEVARAAPAKRPARKAPRPAVEPEEEAPPPPKPGLLQRILGAFRKR